MIRKRIERRDDHAEYRLLAAAAVDGRLDPDSAAALQAHLATCDRCRADQAAMLADHAWLATPATATWPRPTVRELVLDAARAPRVPRTSNRAIGAAQLAAGLVVAIIGVAGLSVIGSSSPSASSSSISGPGFLPSESVAATARPSPLPLSANVPTGPCAPPIADLTAWWTGDADGVDLVTGRVATLRGGARTTPGLVGSAFDFDGKSGYAEVEADPGLRLGTDDFTIMAWVRFDDPIGEQVLVEQWIERDPGVREAAGWTLTKLANNELLFTSEGPGPAQGARIGPLGLELGVWYHLAIRRDGREMMILVNDAAQESHLGDTVLDINEAVPLLLGRRGDDRGFHLDGAIDELKLVIGRALSDEEVRADYLAGTAGTCPS